MNNIFAPIYTKLALIAAIGFAFSCSSGDEPNPTANEATKYCVYKDTRKCYSTSQLNCPAGGEMSDFCPYDGSSVASSSPSVVPSSSSAIPLSSSSVKPSSNSNIIFGTFTDSRDNRSYKYVTIGEQYWMAENLNYNATGSRCYGEGGLVLGKDTIAFSDVKTLSNAEIQDNCAKYGRLYDWATAMGIDAKYNSSSYNPSAGTKYQGVCPNGWHIPNANEWQTLRNYAVDGAKLRAQSGWNEFNGTDNFGFAALPGGYGNSSSIFAYAGSYGSWWSSYEENAKSAYNRYIYYGYNDIYGQGYDKSYLFSVRCLRDNSVSITQSSSSVMLSSSSVSSSSVAPSSSSSKPSSSSSIPSSSSIVSKLIDDFQNGSNLSNLGSNIYWYVYTDIDAGAGLSSTVNNSKDDSGNYNPLSKEGDNYFVGVTGYNLRGDVKAKQPPFVGIGLDNKNKTNLPVSGCTGGFEYDYKGAKHYFRTLLSTVSDYDFHFKTIEASNTWKKVTVSLRDLEQEGWGTRVNFDASKIIIFEWHIRGDISANTGNLSIDNFTCLGNF